jgi:hypothetical protein
MIHDDPESHRLVESNSGEKDWKRWGPYLSERQWGTVREDYSPDGNAWDYLPHDHARSQAYRWGEDGIAGFSDDQQRLCLSLALWNGCDPILKERLFGLTNLEGNHGEDVKECYYYLDATPTHSYLKMLYKYPQRAFPYAHLVEENHRRTREQPEYELLDTGVFDDDAYFDVFVEYAKAAPEDILMRVTVYNRGVAPGDLQLLPQACFRNTWSWRRSSKRPMMSARDGTVIDIQRAGLGPFVLHCSDAPELLFCDNDTNAERLNGMPKSGAYYKDGINDYVVGGHRDAVNPARKGTKAAARYALTIPAHGSKIVRLRLTQDGMAKPFEQFDSVVDERRREADAFYAGLQAGMTSEDARRVHRQALAGMIWTKQFYYFDIPQWLAGDSAQPPPPPQRLHGRDSDWTHLNTADILSMPDKWEFPWFAAWDLAFHCLPLATVDAEFAKQQLVLLTREWYMHPNGQLPAYEWAFGDVNPPVHAWAAWRVFQIDRERRGDQGDLAFLERVFHKLLLNFTWWVNRKDVHGRNVFQGGFLGLDNIGVFDRGAPLPKGGEINQADATSWMAMYCLDLMRMALELAMHNPVYQDTATKFFEHFLYIAAAMTNLGGRGVNLWDDQDEFFYDVLSTSDGRSVPLKVRSIVGLIPLFAVDTLDPELLERVPEFNMRLEWFLKHRPELAGLVSRWWEPGAGERRLLSLLRGHRMKRLLKRMLDETEFLSPYGVRSVSRQHLEHPFSLRCDGEQHVVRYQPGESESGLFGGNSNWRGPVWMPINFLIVESLLKFHHYYGDDFKVECPTGSGRFLTIRQIAEELACRLTRLFLRDEQGRRPALGPSEKVQRDPHFRDHLLFNEYFHGEDGRGEGASHQTGWTGLITLLLRPELESELSACPAKRRLQASGVAGGGASR